MRLLIQLFVAIVVAAAFGFGSALAVLDRERMFGAVTRGAWTAWPDAGRPDADPYSRAILARTGAMPLGAGEGMAFVAETDDGGAALVARCRYSIEGETPAARLWTLTATDRDGRLFDTPAHRAGFHARELLRNEDGRFVIRIAAAPEPGNWLPVTGGERFRLTLRLYDTPLAGSGADDAPFPAIRRIGCP